MIDLSGIARQLHLSVDQIRFAADLIEQGYSPTYISRYRADETGALPRSVLWRLKLLLDRNKRLQAARDRIGRQVPKEVALDSEAVRILENARTVVAMESALRSFRARRALDQSQERDSAAGRLLESMLTYSGPAVDDINAWAGQQIGGDSAAGQQALNQVSRLLTTLIQCDTGLIARLRHAIQRKASIRVGEPAVSAPVHVTQPTAPLTLATPIEQSVSTVEAETPVAVSSEGQVDAELSSPSTLGTDSLASEAEATAEAHDLDCHEAHPEDEQFENSEDTSEDAHSDTDGGDEPHEDSKASTSSKKSGNKMTPRQRRRRWLVSMLAPMRSINKPANRLTAFQQLMLGRGVRSQLISTPLDYDSNMLAEITRDAFADAKHPMANWFTESVKKSLDSGLQHKLEVEALAELEEEASEALLENATDELRLQLMRRPVRGHTIALVDTVGPKTVVVVVIDPHGNVLASDELPCSVQPEVVNQNVVVLGQLIHKHRVTLVALTNGPVRRFMVATLRELMVQSKDSGLRWTMADRSGAEAYAGGRIGLRELATYNRRERAAIWTARCLQNPMVELLKIDTSRLRLGSYQRELPQDVLKQLVTDTIVDCVCSRGIDTLHASENELEYVPGIGPEQAKQIVQLAASGKLTNRAQLKEAIAGWPDQAMRQAIGWLRIFESSTSPLDATLVHPEDYRLAERLIENTELNMPNAAPPGWARRVVPVAASTTSEATPTDAASSTGEDSTSPSATDVAPMSEVGNSATAVNSAESAESNEVNASTEHATAEVASSETDVSDFGSSSSKASSSEEAPKLPAIAPEYPEQIVSSATTEPAVDAEKLAKQWQVGRAKLKSIAAVLQDPFADPRLDGPAVPLRVDLPTLDSLQPDTCVWAIVVGVADFGAFVELAPNCSGLIHISRLSTNFIEDPHQCVQVGDLLMTWVINIDNKKNRVALTALSPAQRAQVAAAAEARRAQIEAEKAAQYRGQRGDRGPRRDGPGQSTHGRQPTHGPAQSRGGHGQGGQGQGGQGQGGQRAGSGPGHERQAAGRGGAPGAGGGNRRPGGGRPERSGGRGGQGDRGRGDRGGHGNQRGDGGRHAKSVVVTSKKPVAPISQAMKQGEEPLRSFSDLMQFYESKRTPNSESPVTPPSSNELPTTDTVAPNMSDSASVTAAAPVQPAQDNSNENFSPDNNA